MPDIEKNIRIATPVESVWAALADPQAFGGLTEPHRRELQVHCYRLLGSLHEAEDVVQETLLRAWRRLDTFEGRASFRAWLYKIATNACFDVLDQRRVRRRLPPATHPPADPAQPFTPASTEMVWLEPIPDEWLDDVEASSQNPEARYAAHESVTLAFLTALQLLPPRQRAVLLMRDVLGWHADEVARLLDLSVSAVNSALHRARATLAKHYPANPNALSPRFADAATRALLERYVRAWEAADVPGLLALFKEEATLAMPPSPAWYAGRAAIGVLAASAIFAGEARGRWRLRPTRANAQPAFGLYQSVETSGVHQARAIQVVELEAGKIAHLTTFFDASLFPYFGLPNELSQ